MSASCGAAALLVAGGTGSRLGAPGGKQMLTLAGRPLLTWAAAALDATPEVGLIVLVCPFDRAAEYSGALREADIKTSWTVAAAGGTRQESVQSGLSVVPEEFKVVAVHDAARPLARHSLISAAIAQLCSEPSLDGVIVGHPSVDSLKLVEGGRITGTLDRDKVWVVQTPQVFRREVLQLAHATALIDGFIGTDDAALVEHEGGVLAMMESPRDNLKVTVPEDVAVAELILSERVQEEGQV